MRYLHTMIRVHDLDASLDFYCNKLGMTETRRFESEEGRFTLVYLSAPYDSEDAKENQAPEVELTYNWDTEAYTGGRNFGHLAFEVDNIYQICQHLQDQGVLISKIGMHDNILKMRPPICFSQANADLLLENLDRAFAQV